MHDEVTEPRQAHLLPRNVKDQAGSDGTEHCEEYVAVEDGDEYQDFVVPIAGSIPKIIEKLSSKLKNLLKVQFFIIVFSFLELYIAMIYIFKFHIAKFFYFNVSECCLLLWNFINFLKLFYLLLFIF